MKLPYRIEKYGDKEMKTLNISALPILILLLLTQACGKGGSSSAKLEISRAFAVTNTYFGGGLIITGKNLSKNQSFTVSLDSTTSISMQLEKGTWHFSAVAWDGGIAPEKKFAGTVYCGLTGKDLVNDSETVDINLGTEKCGDPIFTAGHVDTTTTPYTFKYLDVIGTCSTFFPNEVLPNQTVASSLAQATTPPDFCNNVSEDLKTKVKAIRIHAQNKTLGQVNPTPGFGTECITSATSDSKINLGTSFRLPYKSIPFTIMTFEDENCSKPLTHYDFRNGLSAPSSMFDHILVNNDTSPSQMKLFLPGNDMKRAKSPFLAILPNIKCDDGTTIGKCRTTPSSHADFHGNANGSSQRVYVKNESSCPETMTASYPVASATCFENDNEVEVEFSGSTSGLGSFAMNGNTYSVYLASTLQEHMKYNAHQSLIEMLGSSDDLLPISFFMPEQREKSDTKAHGILSQVREMFSPDGPGGVVGIPGSATTFQKACLDAVVSKEITRYDPEKMKNETFKIVVHNSTVSSPGPAFCNPTNIAETDCATFGVKFDKRMLVYDYSFSSITPAMAFEFSCSGKVGKLEDNSTEIEGEKKHVTQEIISWNTEDHTLTNQRFEKIGVYSEYELNSNSWILQKNYRGMTRIMKSDKNTYEYWKYNYNARRDETSTSFNQHLGFQQFLVSDPTNGKICTFENSEGITDNDLNYFWNNTTFDPLRSELPKITSDGNDIFFYFTDLWETASGSTCPSSFSSLPTGADKFQNTIDFKLESLNSSDFYSKFGTNFMTAP
jgi:hypothetical protein